METLVLALFACMLVGCVVFSVSILWALLAGYVLFSAYALIQKHSFRNVLKMSLSGIRTVRNILIIFVLIGILTAVWRAAGTIPAIVSYSAGLIKPSVLILMTFLLNCLVSVLTGTSFGTAATMGAICATIGTAMNVDPVLVGGAVLSGVFFGDRCSPVSTSALLVATLTRTDIYSNIRWMLRSALVPFLLTCLVYLALGLMLAGESAAGFDALALFAGKFRLGWVPLLPALLIFGLSLFRVNVRAAMSASILCAVAICIVYQNMAWGQVMELMLFGYRSPDPEMAALLDGGGILSMVRVICIVFLAATYSGIFEGTGLLNHLKDAIRAASEKISVFGGILITAIMASMVACNQSFAIILTHQLCAPLEKDPRRFAMDLENSAVVVAPLVPWSIAGAVPLAAISAPATALFAACFLYILPLWWWGIRRISKPGGSESPR